MNPDFQATERGAALLQLQQLLEALYETPRARKVAPLLNADQVRNFLSDLQHPISVNEAITHVQQGLERFSVHTTHPMYFGLFNPRANFTSVLADAIVSAYNPQLAAWSHAPFAVEVERYVVKQIGKRLGYRIEDVEGTFTSGGAEANLTALLSALVHKCPQVAVDGVFSLKAQPVLYCSAESHHSIVKAAKISGIGSKAIRHFATASDGNFDARALINQIQTDIDSGFTPFMIVATAGSTGAGTIDPVRALAQIARSFNLWLHADAAYGSIAVLSDEQKHLLAGIEQADSITVDAHKVLSVSMAAGLFITRHATILNQVFGIETDYMPVKESRIATPDPFTHSIQWSRRFTGLKVYLALLVLGWSGVQEMIARQFAVADNLRSKLRASGWRIFNNSPLPVVCCGKPCFEHDPTVATRVVTQIVQEGDAWLSTFTIEKVNTIRLCVTNYLTDEQDLDQLVQLLERQLESVLRT